MGDGTRNVSPGLICQCSPSWRISARSELWLCKTPLGAPVLPAGITPTTATINHLVYSEKPHAKALLFDDTVKPIDLSQGGAQAQRALADWVTIESQKSEKVRHVEVGWPAEILKDRVTLVDTPGVNDMNEARAEITYNYIPRADAVIFLLDGAQVLKQSERAFLEQRILRRSKDKLIFVIGKADLLSPEEREEAVSYCRRHLAPILENEPALFLISAKQALSGHPEQSGIPPLVDYLQKYLSGQRGRVLLDNASGDGQRPLASVRFHFQDPTDGNLERVQEVVARYQVTTDRVAIDQHQNQKTRSILATQEASQAALAAAQRLNEGKFDAADKDLAKAEERLQASAASANNGADRARILASAAQISAVRKDAQAAKAAPPASPSAAPRPAALKANKAAMEAAGF